MRTNCALGLVAVCAAILQAGCATQAGSGGRYLLISSGQRVVSEVDTGAGGLVSCNHHLAMLQLPGGMTARCSQAAASEPLPFSYKVHAQVLESDGFKPSSPYWVRADTRMRCMAMRDNARRGEKVVIVEDRCS